MTALDELCVNALRFLSVDAVQKADSGHPGLRLGAAVGASTQTVYRQVDAAGRVTFTDRLHTRSSSRTDTVSASDVSRALTSHSVISSRLSLSSTRTKRRADSDRRNCGASNAPNRGPENRPEVPARAW